MPSIVMLSVVMLSFLIPNVIWPNAVSFCKVSWRQPIRFFKSFTAQSNLTITLIRAYMKHLIQDTNLQNKTSCFKYIKFITEDTKVKHTNITTFYKDNQNGKCIQK